MLLFVCLMIIIAMSISAFAFAGELGRSALYKEQAIVLATNTAESFMANPQTVAANREQDGLVVECSVDASVDDIGTMYGAFISVRHENEVIYTLNASKYISHDDADFQEVR